MVELPGLIVVISMKYEFKRTYFSNRRFHMYLYLKKKLIELLIHKMFYGICLSYNGK